MNKELKKKRNRGCKNHAVAMYGMARIMFS